MDDGGNLPGSNVVPLGPALASLGSPAGADSLDGSDTEGDRTWRPGPKGELSGPSGPVEEGMPP